MDPEQPVARAEEEPVEGGEESKDSETANPDSSGDGSGSGVKRSRGGSEEAGGGVDDDSRGWDDDEPTSSSHKRAAIDSGGNPMALKSDLFDSTGAPKMLSVTLLVPNDAMGLMIGKGGIVRQQIANESGCKVKVQDYSDLADGSRERGITFSGTWQSIERAQNIVLEKLKHRRSVRDLALEEGPPLQFCTGEALLNMQSDSERSLIRWLVPNEMCGLLIGKRGAGIHQINNDSGAKVKVGHEEEMPPGSGERVVYIVGTKAANDKAISLIQSKVGGKPAEQPHIDSMTVPLRAIAHLLGPSGSNIRTVRDTSGAKVHVMNLAETEMGSTDSKIGFDGTPEQVAYAKQMLMAKLYEWETEARSKGEDLTSEVTTIKMAVPFPLVGHLIGKGGANIKELLKTGALIKILQEEKSHTRTFDERPVLITGPSRVVLEVQRAVCERMMSAPARVLEQIKPIANPPPPAMTYSQSREASGYSHMGGSSSRMSDHSSSSVSASATQAAQYGAAPGVNVAQVQQAQALLSAYGINIDLALLAQSQNAGSTAATASHYQAQANSGQPYIDFSYPYGTGPSAAALASAGNTAYAAYQALQSQQAASTDPTTAYYRAQQQQQDQKHTSSSTSSSSTSKTGQSRYSYYQG